MDWHAHTHGMRSIHLCNDNNAIITCGNDFAIRLWQLHGSNAKLASWKLRIPNSDILSQIQNYLQNNESNNNENDDILHKMIDVNIGNSQSEKIPILFTPKVILGPENHFICMDNIMELEQTHNKTPNFNVILFNVKCLRFFF